MTDSRDDLLAADLGPDASRKLADALKIFDEFEQKTKDFLKTFSGSE